VAFVRLSPGEFTSAGRAAWLEQFERIKRDRIEIPNALAVHARKKTSEPAIEADLEWDEPRPA
jgi:hypothetical protein